MLDIQEVPWEEDGSSNNENVEVDSLLNFLDRISKVTIRNSLEWYENQKLKKNKWGGMNTCAF